MSDFWTRYVKAQSELEAVVKTQRNNFDRYNYSDIGDIIQTIRRAFNQNGIAFNLVAVPAPDPIMQVAVEAVFSADDGEHRGGPVVVAVPFTNASVGKASNRNTNAFGAAYGFAKRYAAVLGAGLPEVNPEDVQLGQRTVPAPITAPVTVPSTPPVGVTYTDEPNPFDTMPGKAFTDQFVAALNEEPMEGVPSFAARFGTVFFPGVPTRPSLEEMCQKIHEKGVEYNVAAITTYIREQEKKDA